MRWNFASIVVEVSIIPIVCLSFDPESDSSSHYHPSQYRSFAGSRARAANERFIEVSLPVLSSLYISDVLY